VTSERRFRLEQLLPFACIAAAGVLIASELMTTFEFTPPGAEALASQSAGDRHAYAQIVLAVFAVVAMVIAISSGSKPAAMGVAACGVLALLIFLLLDLPDAGNVGTLDDSRQTFATAEAVPQAGFWLQLIGALGLAICGAALATLTPEQLQDLRPGGARPTRQRERKGAAGATGSELVGQTGGMRDEVSTNDAERRAAARSKPR
jgi:hypothetical protein